MLVYWSVGWLVCHKFLNGGKFYFHAPIEAFVPSILNTMSLFLSHSVKSSKDRSPLMFQVNIFNSKRKRYSWICQNFLKRQSSNTPTLQSEQLSEYEQYVHYKKQNT